MDLYREDNYQGSQQQPGEISPQVGFEAKKPKKGIGWKIFFGIILALSMLANFFLLLMLVGAFAVLVTAEREVFSEYVLRDGPRTRKIVVITLEGIIEARQAEDVYSQLRSATRDRHVKGIIIRVNSPGGTISGSDQIHNEICRYKETTGKPAVAFMQGVAASGGYYVSVPCDEIICEPTAITGSIGVIMGHFVLQELLEQKLGIMPVVIKSGEKKDWPSPFQAVTEEQRQYLQEKLITPAYERFVEIVNNGRERLGLADVRKLADGSIYYAQEALESGLVDRIGYLDDAIEQVKLLAGIEKAQVVEYRKPLSFMNLMGLQGGKTLKLDKSTLYELSMPEVLYLWSMY